MMGRLSDRYGRKPVLIVSLCGTAIGSVITGLAGSVWLLLLGRLVDGASGASVSVAQAAVADVAPTADGPRLFGLLGAAFGVGFVLGRPSPPSPRSAGRTSRSSSPPPSPRSTPWSPCGGCPRPTLPGPAPAERVPGRPPSTSVGCRRWSLRLIVRRLRVDGRLQRVRGHVLAAGARPPRPHAQLDRRGVHRHRHRARCWCRPGWCPAGRGPAGRDRHRARSG